MFADAKRERCGITWKLKLLCWANEDCCEFFFPSTETKFGDLDLNPVEKLVVVFRGCVMETDLYEPRLCRFVFARSTASGKCSFSEPNG